MEYRTLSNFWLESPERMTWVYDQVHAVVAHVERECARAGGSSAEYLMKYRSTIENAINTGSDHMARVIMGDFPIRACPV